MTTPFVPCLGCPNIADCSLNVWCRSHCLPTPRPPPQCRIHEPKGCICPPGSEKTCERSDCGRKDREGGR